MNNKTDDEIAAYINSIELPDTNSKTINSIQEYRKTYQPKKNTPNEITGEGKVVFNGIYATNTLKLNEQQQLDKDYTTLFANLVAIKVLEKKGKSYLKFPEEFYIEYTTSLQRLGWIVSRTEFNKLNLGEATVTLDKKLLEYLADILAEEGAIDLLKTIIDALGSDKNPGPLGIFGSASSDNEFGVFNLSYATLDPEGNILLIPSVFYFDAKTSTHRFLWLKWGSSTMTMYSNHTKLHFDDAIMSAKTRQKLIDKLGDNIDHYIDGVDI